MAGLDDTATLTLNKADVILTISSDGITERIIEKGSTNGSLFVLGNSNALNSTNAKLVITGHVSLQGKTDNTDSLVFVYYGASLELTGNAKLKGNTIVKSTGNASGAGIYMSGDESHVAKVFMNGNAEVSGNTAKNTGTGNATGGGVFLSTYCTLDMSGNAKIIGNTCDSVNKNAQGGGVFLANNINDGGRVILSGNAIISGNTLKYKTFGAGGAIMGQLNTIILSGGVSIPSDGNITENSGSFVDTRNTVYTGAASSGVIMIDGTLSASSPVAVIDIRKNFNMSQKVIKQWNGSQPEDYSSGAPLDKFTLGKFVNHDAPYDTADITATKKWHPNGNGSLVNK
jgi:hypothetical protein